MSKISETLSKYESEEPTDVGDEDEGVSGEEVAAMKLFERAKTPEDKASALKEFLKACGAY